MRDAAGPIILVLIALIVGAIVVKQQRLKTDNCPVGTTRVVLMDGTVNCAMVDKAP